LQLHKGTKIILFGEISWSNETKILMTIVMVGGKRGRQAAEHHPNRKARGWQHHVVAVLCCRRDWCTSQNRWHHEGQLCGYIEATSQDISQEVKVEFCSQMGLPNGQ
jgi:hypothetical protein